MHGNFELIDSNVYKNVLNYFKRVKINFFNTIKVFFIVFRIKLKHKFWKYKKRILFPCDNSIDLCFENLPLYLAVYKAGYNLEIYMPIRSLTMIPYYLLLGVSKFHFLFTISPSKLRTKNFKLEFDFDKYIIPSILRKYRIASINDLKEFDKKKEILDLRIENLLNNFSKTNLKNVESVFFADYVYIPQGPLLDYIYTYHKNINILSYNAGHIIDTLVVSKLKTNLKNRHPYSPPFDVFISRKKALNKKESLKLIANIRLQLKNLYKNKEWFNHVGTSQYQQFVEFKCEFGTKKESNNSNSNIFAIFPHIYWDASVAAGDDLFNDYKEWFETTVLYILENTKSNLIVKDHPSNLHKLNSLGIKYKSPIKSFLLSQKEEYKKRVIYLKPDTKISTISVIEKSDYILTVRGTIGIEASLFGKNVIFAGTGRFNDYGFGIFPNNIDDYFRLIKKASTSNFEIEEENILNAALYLDILWNQMTFFQDTVKSIQNDNGSNFLKNINTINMKSILKDIDELSKWIEKPTSTYLKSKK